MTDVLDTQWQLDPEVILTSVGDEAVLLHPETNTYFGLDALGTLIVKRLNEDHAPRQIVDEIVAGFLVDHDRAATDLSALLGELRDHGLIVAARPDQPVD